MFRFWLFGVIILTTTISLNAHTGKDGCHKECVSNAGPEILGLAHPAKAKYGVKDSDATELGCVEDCPNYDVLIGHHYCSKYCECLNSQASVKNCGKGYYFSTSQRNCVVLEESDCAERSEPQTRLATRPTSTRPPPTDSRGCIGKCPLCNDPKKTDQLPHEDPTKFCKCDWGKPVVFECPDGLVYNKSKEVCDYPFEANCTGTG